MKIAGEKYCGARKLFGKCWRAMEIAWEVLESLGMSWEVLVCLGKIKDVLVCLGKSCYVLGRPGKSWYVLGTQGKSSSPTSAIDLKGWEERKILMKAW